MYKKGFIKSGLIINLFAVLVLLPILWQCYQLIACFPKYYQQMQDLISLRQLQHILLVSYEQKVEDNELNFRYQGKDFRLRVYENHLLLSPGSQFFMGVFAEAYFELEGDLIILNVVREKSENSYILGQKESFSIADFSFESAADNEPDTSLQPTP